MCSDNWHDLTGARASSEECIIITGFILRFGAEFDYVEFKKIASDEFNFVWENVFLAILLNRRVQNDF